MTPSSWGEPRTGLPAARVGGTEAAGGGAADISILIADDHEVVREGLVAMINRQPGMHVVAQAGNGAQAAALWTQHRPDITLVDLRMPELDGRAFYALLRQHSPALGARVIFLTGVSDEAEHQALAATTSRAVEVGRNQNGRLPG